MNSSGCFCGWDTLYPVNAAFIFQTGENIRSGQRECDFSIDSINRCIRDIEQASLAAVSQSLATRDDISVEVCGAVWSA